METFRLRFAWLFFFAAAVTAIIAGFKENDTHLCTAFVVMTATFLVCALVVMPKEDNN